MWAVRILNGPQAGQIFNLKSGKNILGRAGQADIQVIAQGVSKAHCEIQVLKDKIIIVDLKSSNGTYVNGIKIQNSILHLGEKFSLHEILLDIVPAQELRPARSQLPAVSHSGNAYPAVGNAALQMGNFPQPHVGVQSQAYAQAAPAPEMAESAPSARPNLFAGILEQFKAYLERVVLPGVYKLAQMFDFKLVLLGFVGAFIFIVTLLSMIPMSQLAKSSILKESRNRASSLARNLAATNKKAVVENSGALSTYSAEVEEGVKTVFIIQDIDGMILAPSTKAGRVSELSFVQKVRKERRALTVELDSSTIAASAPIEGYDVENGEMKTKAHAIVIYDVSSLAFDEGKTISLFMQTLMIASLVGFFLFFFIYKLIEFPIKNLSLQLDTALREKRSDLEMTFQFEPLQNLIANMNSVLTRSHHGEGGGGQAESSSENRDEEASNLTKMIGAPAMVVAADNRILSANSSFEQLARVSLPTLQQNGLTFIPDNSLQQNIEHLMGKSREVPYAIHSDHLEFNGLMCTIQCQGFLSGNSICYFLITILPQSGAPG